MDNGQLTPPDITTRHGFLAALHDLLQPRVYLEIGVQHGYSLNLAHAAEMAIGVDPNPLIPATGNQLICAETSDSFFEAETGPASLVLRDRQIDLGFIDGMHLIEYVVRDFINIERYCHPRSAVVFDDVLPRNAHEARRIEPGMPIIGDWTGDVWQVGAIIRELRPDLTTRLVNVQPTGLLVVTGFRAHHRQPKWDWEWLADSARVRGADPSPDIYCRAGALRPLVALQQIRREFYPGEEAP